MLLSEYIYVLEDLDLIDFRTYHLYGLLHFYISNILSSLYSLFLLCLQHLADAPFPEQFIEVLFSHYQTVGTNNAIENFCDFVIQYAKKKHF